MPFPTTLVIHQDFSAHHQPVADGTKTGVCRVEVPGVGTTWDPVLEQTVPAAPIIQVPAGTICRVQQYMRAVTAQQGGQAVTERRYRVTVPTDSGTVSEGAVVVIEACKDDPRLVGHRLSVTDVQYGTILFERALICSDNED